MKRTNVILCIILFMMAGCGGGEKSGSGSEPFITVDVTMKYHKKELILQDLFDVEYIVLDDDEFVCQGIVLAVGKDVILVKNQINDGDLFVFDRKGKGLRKINRKGNGGEEYTFLSNITFDENNNEMFINDNNRILVYDLFGKFKRRLPNNEELDYGSISIFDNDHLICNDTSFDLDEETDRSPFVIISKQDGNIIENIHIFSQLKIPEFRKLNYKEMIVTTYGKKFSSVPAMLYHDSWILTLYSNDTVFRYLPDQSIIPFIVRTPSIESKESESYLNPGILIERYYFLQTVAIEPEAQGTNPMDTKIFYPTINLVYDRQEKTIYEYTIVNEDFTNQTITNLFPQNGNDEIAFWRKIEAYQLVEAYKKGELKGKLKEVAADLNEDSNPVIMLVKYKK